MKLYKLTYNFYGEERRRNQEIEKLTILFHKTKNIKEEQTKFNSKETKNISKLKMKNNWPGAVTLG